jgi:molecular chaperone GrpE (heat shock protein)
MEKEFEQLNSKITQCLTELFDTKTQLKDITQEKQDQIKKFYEEIIEVLDTFERVEEGLNEKYSTDNGDISKVRSRYQVIQKKLLDLLSKHGVTKTEFPENTHIVGFSKVIETEPDPAKKNDTIISIIKNGYHRGSEIIRKAELNVVKN